LHYNVLVLFAPEKRNERYGKSRQVFWCDKCKTIPEVSGKMRIIPENIIPWNITPTLTVKLRCLGHFEMGRRRFGDAGS